MGLFFVYILKSSVCLAIFYLFYRLLLTRDVSSFQPFFIVGHFAVVLPIAFGRGKCEAGDGSAPDDADIGAVADDGRCSECH